MLAAEADAGSGRSEGLKLFFQALNAALQDLYDDEANGVPQSPHHKSLPDFLITMELMCARLWLMRKMRALVLVPADCGLFAAFLSVLDALLLAPPDVAVTVDWRLRGNEQHFTYAPPAHGEPCVWKQLFEPLERAATSDGGGPRDRERAAGLSGMGMAFDVDANDPMRSGTMAVNARFNLFFVSRFRWLSRHAADAEVHRRTYHRLYARWVRPRHPRLVQVVRDIGGEIASATRRAAAQIASSASRAGAVSVGVHKRVDTPGTVEFQGSRRLYTSADVIEALRRLARQLHPRPIACVFLATDDARAERSFRNSEFGRVLLLRRGVQRVLGGLNADGTLNEVHIRSPHNPGCSLEDAVDVVADAMLLSQCDYVLHMDSNVTTAVGLMGRDVRMLHVIDVLGERGAVRGDILAEL